MVSKSCLVMKIWTFLNHYLLNSKGGNFLNQRLWTTICCFCVLMMFFIIWHSWPSFDVKNAMIWRFTSCNNVKSCFSIKFDNSLGIEDKFNDFQLSCVWRLGNILVLFLWRQHNLVERFKAIENERNLFCLRILVLLLLLHIMLQ